MSELDPIKLQQFFKDIARLTIRHKDIGGVAAVTAEDLGDALEKADPNWFEDISGGQCEIS